MRFTDHPSVVREERVGDCTQPDDDRLRSWVGMTDHAISEILDLLFAEIEVGGVSSGSGLQPQPFPARVSHDHGSNAASLRSGAPD